MAYTEKDLEKSLNYYLISRKGRKIKMKGRGDMLKILNHMERASIVFCFGNREVLFYCVDYSYDDIKKMIGEVLTGFELRDLTPNENKKVEAKIKEISPAVSDQLKKLN